MRILQEMQQVNCVHSCLQTFCESGHQGAFLQRLVNRLHPGFCCEGSKCSPFSPGPVNDDEEIIFLLINPTHFDKERSEVVPLAFQEVHNRDLSVLRAPHTSEEDVESTVEELISRGMDRVPPQLRYVEFGCTASAATIRAVAPHGDRLFAIYDTALEEKPGHASIFTQDEVLDDRRTRARARSELHRIFTESVVTVKEIKARVSSS